MDELIQIAHKWNNVKTDAERFQFLLDNPGYFIVMLDNDMTSVTWTTKALENSGFVVEDYKWDSVLPDLIDFYGYLERTDCVIALLGVVGIECDTV